MVWELISRPHFQQKGMPYPHLLEDPYCGLGVGQYLLADRDQIAGLGLFQKDLFAGTGYTRHWLSLTKKCRGDRPRHLKTAGSGPRLTLRKQKFYITGHTTTSALCHHHISTLSFLITEIISFEEVSKKSIYSHIFFVCQAFF